LIRPGIRVSWGLTPHLPYQENRAMMKGILFSLSAAFVVFGPALADWYYDFRHKGRKRSAKHG
jgi:hypothetical protein